MFPEQIKNTEAKNQSNPENLSKLEPKLARVRHIKSPKLSAF